MSREAAVEWVRADPQDRRGDAVDDGRDYRIFPISN
jgi:hypothetical protein